MDEAPHRGQPTKRPDQSGGIQNSVGLQHQAQFKRFLCHSRLYGTDDRRISRKGYPGLPNQPSEPCILFEA